MNSEPQRCFVSNSECNLMDISQQREREREDKRKKRTQHAPSAAFRRFRLRFLPRFG